MTGGPFAVTIGKHRMSQKDRGEATKAAFKLLLSAEEIPPPLRLRALREASNLSLAELGALLGCSAPGISDWENGKDLPSRAFPHKIEAWSGGAVADLGLPAHRVLRSTDWLTAEERAACERLAGHPSEAA